MKYIVAILLLTFTFTLQAQRSKKRKVRQDTSQTRALETYYLMQGTHQLNASVGFLNAQKFAFNLLGGSGSGNPTPSANIEYIYGLNEKIGVGLHFNYYRVDSESPLDLEKLFDQILNDPIRLVACRTGINLGNQTCNTSLRERIGVFTIAAKGEYHIKRFNKIDTYTSAIVGYSFNRRNSFLEDVVEGILNQLNIMTEIPSFVYAASIGARYYPTPQYAVFGEYGAGRVHTLRLGASYRFL